MKAKNEKMSVAQIAAANEQFLTAQMAEIGIIGETLMESKITLGRILATGIFTGLSLLAPSLVGFNLYAISRLIGGIGTKIDAKIQNKFLAARNSKMLSKDAEEIEKQKVELGKKPIDTRPEANLPKNAPIVSNVPEGANPLLERAPVEFALSGANYFSIFGFRDGRPISHHQIIQEAINEEIKQKAMLIGQYEKKAIALGGGITAQGDLKQTLEAIKSKYNFDQFAKIADTLTKYYEAIQTGKTISDIEGMSAYHILRYISEKINNGEMLNDFEEDALDIIIDVMKSAQSSYKNIYSGFFSRKGYKTGDISGIAPFYKLFLSKIATTLYRNGVITTDPDKNLIGAVKEFTVAIKMSENDLWRQISRIKNGELYGATEGLLSKICVSLENLISSRLPRSASYIKYAHSIMYEIQQDFDFINFIQGDLSKNKFYGKTRLLIYKIKDIISATPIPNYKGTIESLNLDVLKGINIVTLYFDIKDVRGPPSLERVALLRASIIDNLGPYLTSAQLDKIFYLVDDFKASILSYHRGINLLSIYKDSFRKALISDLIDSKFTMVLQQCESKSSLSDLLFGDRDDLFKFFYNKEEIYHRPDLYILEHIKLRVSLWTTADFKNENLNIDQTALDSLIEEVIGKIDRFITYDSLSKYRRAYKINFIEEFNYLSRYIEIGYEKELEVIQAFHSAVTAFTGNSKISLKMLGESVGLSGFYQASEGHHFSIGSFRKIIGLLETLARGDTSSPIMPIGKYDFMSRLTLDQRLEIYENALNTIQKYMKEFGMERPKNWNDEHVEAYHIFKLLKRNLGFEMISFTTLDKSIFIKIKGKIQNFARHHFRNDFFRKLSNYVQDLILTDNRYHAKYESYSEAQMLVILNGFNKMMNMKGTGKDGRITKNDVIDIFKGNEWVLKGPNGNGGKKKNQGWFFSDIGFDNMLEIFNERKIKLKNEGLDQFIIDYYDTVYERFYLNFPHGTLSNTNIADADGFYSLVVPHPWLGDFAMGMNFDAKFLYPEY